MAIAILITPAIIIVCLVVLGSICLRRSVLSRIGFATFTSPRTVVWQLAGFVFIGLAVLLFLNICPWLPIPGGYMGIPVPMQQNMTLPDKLEIVICSPSCIAGMLSIVLAVLFAKDGIGQLTKGVNSYFGKAAIVVWLTIATVFLASGSWLLGTVLNFVVNGCPLPGYAPLPRFIPIEFVLWLQSAVPVIPYLVVGALLVLGLTLSKQGVDSVRERRSNKLGWLRLVIGLTFIWVGSESIAWIVSETTKPPDFTDVVH